MYDSSKVDPADYIMAFESNHLLHKGEDTDSDSLYCRLFPCAFNREALNWLAKLSLNCISL